jgi:hypothetical protein
MKEKRWGKTEIIYGMARKEKSIPWEVIISIILKKKLYM